MNIARKQAVYLRKAASFTQIHTRTYPQGNKCQTFKGGDLDPLINILRGWIMRAYQRKKVLQEIDKTTLKPDFALMAR
ncbi:hypothetical protein [Pararhodobacter sp.]|uniref:hypothetical protein n=1 Tax=Pararhodobacter sp. TaxID=2127056 RepID=UPI002AFEF628|nr:hypothetical protein [Pararhodobacter sp.]